MDVSEPSKIEFDNDELTPSEIASAAQREGMIAIHDFIPISYLARAAAVLMNEPMQIDNSALQRYHEFSTYSYDHDYPKRSNVTGFPPAPPSLFTIARHIHETVVQTKKPHWSPNVLMGHRYDQGDFVPIHKDGAQELYYSAELTVDGEQGMYFKRVNGIAYRFVARPGTLTLIRGFTPNTPTQVHNGPAHWVDPAPARRLALSLHQLRVWR